MATVGTAEYEVEISRAKVKAEVDAAGRQIEQGLGDSAERAAKEIEDKLSRVRDGLGLGITAGTTLLLRNATQAASSLAEAQGKARSVFAESYDEVQKFAAGAAQALGQSEREVLDSVGTYGNLLQAMGLSTEQAKDMSIEFVKLGTDLAAFSDIPVDEAIVALRSGLSGETEPLKRFGVNLNQARIEAEALTQGLWDGSGAIDSAAKAQAAYSIILQDTTLAQGTFARESDSAAGQMRIAGAEAENTSASIGEALLPVMAKAAEVVGVLARAFGDLPGPVQTGIVGIGGFTLAAGLLAPKIREGVQVMQLAGSKAADFGKNLIGPTKAVEGLGSTSAASTGKLSGLLARAGGAGPALGVLAIGAGIVTKAWIDNEAAAARVEQNIKSLVETAEASGRALADVFGDDLAAFLAGLDGLDVGDTGASTAAILDDMGVSAAELRDQLTGTDAEFQKFRANVFEKTGGDFILGQAAIKDLDELRRSYQGAEESAAKLEEGQDSLGTSAKGAADAEKGLADATADTTDIAEDAAKVARELFDARRQAAGGSEAIAAAERGVVEAHERVADASRSLSAAHKAVGDAARSVEDAERGLADARVTLAERTADLAQAQHEQRWGNDDLADAVVGVADAEKRLAEAQQASLDAQDALNAARLTAKERLDDLQQAVDRQGLDRREAELALKEARAALTEGPKIDSAKTGETAEQAMEREKRNAEARRKWAEQRESLQIRVERAEHRLADVLERNAEREAELADEKRKGVEASDEVVAANERITAAAEAEEEARQGVEDAHSRVAEVQQELAQRVVEAQKRVVEAQDAVREATLRVRDAVDAVRDAQQRVIEQRAAVVEAQAGIEDAERKVIQAKLDHIEALAEVKEKTDSFRAATQLQIDMLGDLAATLAPGDPLRRDIEGLISDLERASGTWAIDVVLGIREGDIQIGSDISLRAAEAAFGGRRAAGGRVQAGVSYLVGDGDGLQHAEVFTPDQPGVIVPSTAEWKARQPVDTGTGAGGGIVFEKGAIDASGIKDPNALAASVGSVVAWQLQTTVAH